MGRSACDGSGGTLSRSTRIVLGLLFTLMACVGVTFADGSRAAYADTGVTFPPSIIVKTFPKSAVAGTACMLSVPCLALTTAGSVACSMYCDDALHWLDGKLFGGESLSNGIANCIGTLGWVHRPDPADGRGSPLASYNWQVNVGTPCGGSAFMYTDVTCRNIYSHTFSTISSNWGSGWSGTVSLQNGINSASDGNNATAEKPLCGGSSPQDWEVVYVSVTTSYGMCSGEGCEDSHATWAAETNERQARIEVTCKNAVSGALSTALGPVVHYFNSSTPADITYPQCPAGTFPTQLVVRVANDGAPIAAGDVVVKQTTDLAEYPQCQDLSTPCELRIVNPGTAQEACKWGPYVMPDSDCETQPVGEPSTDTDPDPDPTPTAGLPGSGSNPDPATGEETGTDNPPAADPTDTNGGNCIGGAWSFNPLNWVYVPVKCAFKWAFVPSSAALATSISGLGNAWGDTVLGNWIDAIGDIGGSLAGLGGGGCAGPSVDVLTAHDLHPLSACAAPMSTVAQVVNICLSVLVYVGVALASFNAVAAAFGFTQIWVTWARDDG